ncbi:hypothetical protein D3C87_1544740 [compost metagenome]
MKQKEERKKPVRKEIEHLKMQISLLLQRFKSNALSSKLRLEPKKSVRKQKERPTQFLQKWKPKQKVCSRSLLNKPKVWIRSLKQPEIILKMRYCY